MTTKKTEIKQVRKSHTDASPKELRDEIFAWLYITCSQFAAVTGAASDAVAIQKVTKDLGTFIDLTTPGLTDKITALVKNVRVYNGSFAPVANELIAFGPGGWSGTTDHPGLKELKSIFI